MYAATRSRREPDGLGIVPLVAGIIVAVAGVGGTIAASYIARPRSPSQMERERLLRLQAQLEIDRMTAQQQQTESLMRYALPVAGVLALVTLLR